MLDVDAPAEDISRDEEGGEVVFELVVDLDASVLWYLGVDAKRLEEGIFEYAY